MTNEQQLTHLRQCMRRIVPPMYRCGADERLRMPACRRHRRRLAFEPAFDPAIRE